MKSVSIPIARTPYSPIIRGICAPWMGIITVCGASKVTGTRRSTMSIEAPKAWCMAVAWDSVSVKFFIPKLLKTEFADIWIVPGVSSANIASGLVVMARLSIDSASSPPTSCGKFCFRKETIWFPFRSRTDVQILDVNMVDSTVNGNHALVGMP